MYHLDDELDEILAFKALVGGDRGACFGTCDPSRLRPPFSRKEVPEKKEGEGDANVKILIEQSKQGTIIRKA